MEHLKKRVAYEVSVSKFEIIGKDSEEKIEE